VGRRFLIGGDLKLRYTWGHGFGVGINGLGMAGVKIISSYIIRLKSYYNL
jgi:hypothetical protein